MRFSNKVVVVTGAGSGIGAATARLFASEGARVIVADIANQDSVVSEIVARGGTADAFFCDVSNSESVKALMAKAVESFGGLDIVVSNAGIGVLGLAEPLSEADWDRCQAVNVRGGFLCAKHALPHLRAAHGGVVLFTASIAGLEGLAGSLAYAASKAALINMARTLALDHAHEDIRFNVVCPGATDTPLLRSGAAPIEAIAAMQPLRRVVSVEEIAEGFAYLASPAARSITGQTLVIDAGASAGNTTFISAVAPLPH